MQGKPVSRANVLSPKPENDARFAFDEDCDADAPIWRTRDAKRPIRSLL
jgi:hypothetical protein